MRRRPPLVFERPWLILCEGQGDKRLFDRLLRLHGIDAQFSVEFPGQEDHPSGGRSKFAKYLSTAQTASETFRENVKVVLIVSDNDDNQADSFKEITDALKGAGLPAPKNVQQLAKRSGSPAIGVLMIPLGAEGNLETLCVNAAYDKWQLRAALDAYVAATPANAWSLSKQSKMRMQALLAATCFPKPDTNLANHWQEQDDYHIPVNHSSFDGIVAFLRDFPSFVTR